MSDVTTLGVILYGKQERDAVHVAVAPVTANAKVYPGQHVGLAEAGNCEVVSPDATQKVGVVDPFLTHPVEVGDQFWLWLYPQTITALRHSWTHPAFGAPEMGGSKAWMEQWANAYGFTADKAIQRARGWLEYGDYWVEGGTFEGERIPPEFWTHFEAITGERVPDDKRESFVSCSC